MPRRLRRISMIAAGTLAGAVIVVALAVIVLTQTSVGREQVRNIALHAVHGPIHGVVHLGRIEGNLLTGIAVDGLSITDSAGSPLLSAQRAEVHYAMTDLLHKRLFFDHVRIDHPVVVLEQTPDGVWNYKRIFRSGSSAATDTTPSWGSWITLRDVRVTDADLTMRQPWQPDSSLTGAARDSAIKAALDTSARPNIVAVGADSYQKITEARSLTTVLPVVRLADPQHPVKVVQVASLETDLALFRPPVAKVRDLTGTVFMSADSLWWTSATIRLPASRVMSRGAFNLATGDLALAARARPVALSDAHFANTHFPTDGQLAADIGVVWHGKKQRYSVRNLVFTSGNARVAGYARVELGDTLNILGTDLRFSGIDARLVKQFSPELHVPPHGVLSGHAAVAGGMQDLTVNTDLTVDDSTNGQSHVTVAGGLALSETDGARSVRARSLTVTLDPLQLALAKIARPSLPVRGTLSGRATIDGSTMDSLRTTADLTHRDGDSYTHIVATGDVAFAPPAGTAPGRDAPSHVSVSTSASGREGKAHPPKRRPPLAGIATLDAGVMFDTVDLATLGRFAPAAKLRGKASGPIHVSGTMHALAVHSALQFEDGGTLNLDGTFDLASREIGYTVTAAAQRFNANAVVATAPRTAVTATASATGRGFSPRSMRSKVTADVRASLYDTLAVDTAHVHASVDDGLLQIDSTHFRAFATLVDLNGQLGLDSTHSGEMTYRVAADSLSAFKGFLRASDTGAVAPRPAVLNAAVQRARADSARLAKATEVERAVRGQGPPRLAVDSPRVFRRDSLAGRLLLSGTVGGSTKRFKLVGDLDASGIVALGNSVRDARAQYRWQGGPSLAAPLVLAVQLDTVSAGGFALDTVNVRFQYHKPEGSFALVLRNGDREEYSVAAAFDYSPGVKEFRYDQLGLRLDSTTWRATRPGVVRWGSRGIELQGIELLSNRDSGRLYADGTLPLGAPNATSAHFQVAIDNFPIGDVSSLLESDVPVAALVSLRATVAGTAAAPVMSGSAGLAAGWYRGTPIPDVHLRFAYDTTTLVANGRLDHTALLDSLLRRTDPTIGTQVVTRPIVDVSATVPVNLALSGAVQSRLLDRSLTAELKADSIPMGLIPIFVTSVSTARGQAHAHVTFRGTAHRPQLNGEIALTDGLFHIVPIGVTLTNVATNVRLLRDTIVVDSLVARSVGRVRLHGLFDVSDPSVPVLDVTTSAHNARVLKTKERGTLDIDDSLTIAGPVLAPYVSGSVLVRDGVLYIPDVGGKSVIDVASATVSYVADTTDPAIRAVIPTKTTSLTNLRMDVDVSVNQNTWVRNKDANVEVFTDDPLTVRINPDEHAMVVDGVVTTDRGQYTFLSKRFEITRGTATFIGTSQLDPTVDATGQYTTSVPGRQPLNILVLIGGTVTAPSLTLSSDAEPPLSQTDLFTLLAFGSPASQLSAGTSGAGGSSAGGTSASGISAANLAGSVGPYVAQRLAGIAIGTLTQQWQSDLGRSIGADVLNITPAPGVPTDVSAQGVSGYLRNTELEFGKYATPQMYVGLDVTPIAPPGATVQRQIGRRSTIQFTLQPWYLADPTLSPNADITTKDVFGVSVAREWRF